MKLCRYRVGDEVRIGLVAGGASVLDLTDAGITQLHPLLESDGLVRELRRLSREKLPLFPLAGSQTSARRLTGGGLGGRLTYRRSKTARMRESDFSASAYDRVYAAPRPEIFFKAIAEKPSRPATHRIRASALESCPSRSWRWC